MRLPALLLGLLATACGSAPSGTAWQERSQAIVDGTPAPEDDAAVALVARRVRCDEPEPMLICSGALVGPDLVLTAAHCLDIFGEDGQYEVFLGDSLPDGRYVQVRQAWRHPAYDAATHAFDVALLRLATPVDVQPYPLPEAHQVPEPGISARAIGFGETRDAVAQPGRRRQGDTTVTEVLPASFRASPAPAMSCTGDSGGPVLITRDGEEHLAGITVSGDIACASEAVMVRTDALLDDFLGPALTAEPPTAPPPSIAPAALCTDACESADDCPSGLACVQDAEGIGRCLLLSLQEGSYGAACWDDASCDAGSTCARLEPEGVDACRCFTPCTAIQPEPPVPPGAGAASGCSTAGVPGAVPWPLSTIVLAIALNRLVRVTSTSTARTPMDGARGSRRFPVPNRSLLLAILSLSLGTIVACGSDGPNTSDGSGGTGGSGGMGGAGPTCGETTPPLDETVDREWATWPVGEPPSYLVCDEVVEDETTGLIWQRYDHPDDLAHADAVRACEELDLRGWTDWRLPTQIEFASLLERDARSDYGVAEAAFPDQASAYWTRSLSREAASFIEISSRGGEGYTSDRSNHNGVRCVRGGKVATQAYEVEGEVVRDLATGLVWARPVPAPPLDWHAAEAHCADLEIGGADDWRLPSMHELLSLVRPSRSEPVIDGEAFPDTPSTTFWTGDKTSATTPGHWLVVFGGPQGGGAGYAKRGVDSDVSYNRSTVRCVRGG